MKTIKDIIYKPGCGYKQTLIPAGTEVVRATNLPTPNKFWANSWPGMSDESARYQRNYGFLLSLDEVI